MVVKLRAEERPVDLAFVRIMLALGKAVLPTWLEGETRSTVDLRSFVKFFFLRWVRFELVETLSQREEGEVPGEGSKRNPGDMVRQEGVSGGINLAKGRNPLAVSRGVAD